MITRPQLKRVGFIGSGFLFRRGWFRQAATQGFQCLIKSLCWRVRQPGINRVDEDALLLGFGLRIIVMTFPLQIISRRLYATRPRL
jgi:hypothetical protein